MPSSNRSRTENWKHCLSQIAERNGSLELAVKVDHLLNPGGDLIWRVRLLQITDKEIVVEHPAAVGRTFKLSTATELVCGMTIGQNRWMFGTRVVGARTVKTPTGRDTPGLILALPDKVERCSRREFFRVPTAQFNLAQVECWPLLDPTSAVTAETVNRAMITDQLNGVTAAPTPEDAAGALALPNVGPKFHAKLLNVSGGGIGLMFEPKNQGSVDRNAFLWVKVNLQPVIATPVAMTLKRCHTHLDSAQNLYGGFSFEFSFHAAHQRFVVDLFTRYVELIESRQREARQKAA
ncbi:MAG TPA: hypothetical protein VEB22_12300 [Phycisphaerales bacterium]|nr:hypothetical protein [Phycisphaerales bacterium]